MAYKITNENYSSITINYTDDYYILDYDLNEDFEFYNLDYLRNLIDFNNNLDIYKFNKCGFTGKFGNCDCCNSIEKIYKNVFINYKSEDQSDMDMIKEINNIIKIKFNKSMFTDKENLKNISYINSLLIENENKCLKMEVV